MQRRAIQRQRVLKAGSIEFDGRTIDCTLRNISPLGAALKVANHYGIPHEFQLNILTSNIRRNCRVVWRSKTVIGLSFT